jgi:glycosyltransferase involved in cell wall biosynthesis
VSMHANPAPGPSGAPTCETLGVVLLTFNSIAVIEETVNAASGVAGRIVAVDSGSTDGTVDRLASLGCEVISRPFLQYADQRNWIITTLEPRFAWQLHLDADEVLDAAAVTQVRATVESGGNDAVYLLQRRTFFMGRRLRFGGASSWHLRLFRSGSARCEDRLYDQHFVSVLPRVRLRGWLDDRNVGNVTEWTARHNRWSSLEAAEISRHEVSTGQVHGRLSGDPRERRRLYKGLYYRLPRGWRAVCYFLFRYGVQLGFLDGAAGFYYAVLQALWFRVLVDAKLSEIDESQAAKDVGV